MLTTYSLAGDRGSLLPQCNLGSVLKRNKTNGTDRKNRWRTGLNPGIHLIKTVDNIKTDYDNKIKQRIAIG